MYFTECTLELQGLSSGELAELAGGQSELVALKLQSDRSLWLGDTILTACNVGQLGNLHHVSTFNGKDRHFIKDSIKKSSEMSDSVIGTKPYALHQLVKG